MKRHMCCANLFRGYSKAARQTVATCISTICHKKDFNIVAQASRDRGSYDWVGGTLAYQQEGPPPPTSQCIIHSIGHAVICVVSEYSALWPQSNLTRALVRASCCSVIKLLTSIKLSQYQLLLPRMPSQRAVLKRVPSAERSVMRSVLQHTKTRAAYACGK